MRPEQERAAALLRRHFDPDYDRRIAEQARKKLLADLREVVNSIPGLSAENPKDDTWVFSRGRSRKLVVRVTATDFLQWAMVAGSRQDLSFFSIDDLTYDPLRAEMVCLLDPEPGAEARRTAVEYLAEALVKGLRTD